MICMLKNNNKYSFSVVSSEHSQKYIPRPAATQPLLDTMERRHSLDIVLDFPALIAARKAELEKIRQREEGTLAATTSEMIRKSSDELRQELEADVDDSFGAFERMCDKTGSDPDSTLFQYLHSDDKDQVLAQAKERSARADKSGDLEMEALRRMLEDVSCQQQLDNESPLKGVECTQLEDIEAPSRLWENDYTISGNDSVLLPQAAAKTSPVKMVGLLRPSTILEASSEADLSDYQTESSFQTAAASIKATQSLETIASGSSCYETAADNSLASSCSKETGAATSMNVDDLFYAAIAKGRPLGMSKGEEEELLIDLQETLLDLVAKQQNETIASEAAEDTIIELSSGSEDEEDCNVEIKQEQQEKELEEQADEFSSSEEENKENKSLQFNDTMEEMEYMMQKGMEYMAKAQAAKTNATASKPTTPIKPQTPIKSVTPSKPATPKLLPKQSTFVLTPKESPLRSVTNSANKKQPLSASVSSRYALNMDKPIGKFFKQPSAIPMRRNLKPLKDQFAHIVSPIRTYTQKSSTAPLMSMFRQAQNVNDAFDKLSCHEFQEESRLCQLKRPPGTFNMHATKLSNCIDPRPKLLPKKAYISSELKQVVDERTPLPMPNVPKIQKYLNSAVEPMVLRHDGKLKMNEHDAGSHIPPRVNQSLGDLSLASGDISLYTIKDAQKF
ncbi:uncharacterized protein LOC133850114 isoform X2 [Drosophila sulfurigaster albostrigata]|uniref:uncharacterized protein LOC133850114 isoform X2 n=2 Tax=Drosophila sulfurigaster albostrigata TaxID=89887 RepID=UPI002D21A93A|nr:uncharacterized protein LOC133850114 isoform X2 [Drosophila sulfurigaster albostrigata]